MHNQIALKGRDLLKFFFNRERKYLDNDYWFRLSRNQAKALGLDVSPRLDILDIGLGSGHFVAVCRGLGHHCIGLDQVGGSSYQECAEVDRN